MKLRELLQQLKKTQEEIGASAPYICGGTPRDKHMGKLQNIADMDITTGDKTVDYLSQEYAIKLRRKYNVTRKTMEDGHSTIFIGNLKMDFSSNFIVHNIDDILRKMGIENPSNIQREMYSRDFTCNSLLMTLDLSKIIDPLKRGFQDIAEHKIRTCLAPEITLTSNRNRVIRAIYLACKLGFDIDDSIVDYVSKNPQTVKISTAKSMNEKLTDAFSRDPDKANYFVTKMNLWEQIPIVELAQPYYQKYTQGKTMPKNKVAYFQGGGGVNEPAPPGERKYTADPALVVQPRFEEPFYRNYDLYNVPGQYGPGAGWHDVMKYPSIKEFLEFRRKRLQGKYVADDSWTLDSGKKTKENPEIKARAALFNRIIKTAADENDGPNFDYGDGAYTAMSEGKKMKTITDAKHKSPGAFFADDNAIDFPIDDMVNRQDQMIYPEEDEYQIRREKGDRYQFPSDGSPLDPGELNISMTTPQIAGEHSYLPDPDFEGKSDNGSQLDFGRDYTEETLPGRPSASDTDSDDDNQTDLDGLESKYLESSEIGLFGLPDGVDPEGHDADQTEQIERPFTGTSDIGTQIYDDKWNI